ncbi:CDP-glucose 4,6-dehydratase [Sphingobium sp.]|uniref:CDP-glucose 4,6-dehydratase n=1 Tax=Sphingobium sp. TaxID=1912891 RepID=UPI002B87C890|nr:CDP-glucose 4,6-dehydratase [Sphingobium sp.]HUD92658.1 CDP-glucose 4,6-dehydratase [Sphingobium sp.]
MPDQRFDEERLSRALAGRRILLTGHTGFKGGWLALWLRRLGADTTAVALPPCDRGPSLFEAIDVDGLVDHRLCDIRDEAAFAQTVMDLDPDLVIHMAAQALVRPSYVSPVETFQTNVVGTAVVLDAARRFQSLKGVVVVTSDKCYDNQGWDWGYRESDRLGGSDPYSASKGCAELVVDSYRRSFFAEPDSPILASVRAGNVFGGGDWSVDRLVPDIIRAVEAGKPVQIRNPASVRPWQHVLEPLAGYLMLAARMLEGDRTIGGAWNFGPDADATVDVATLAGMVESAWGRGAPNFVFGDPAKSPPEAAILRLDSQKARERLGWRPRLTLADAVALTVEWYRAGLAGRRDLRLLSERQIARYVMGVRPATLPQFDPVFREAAACA